MSTIENFEYVFLGGGKGGKTLAIELAKAGKRVAVIERGMIGGSCINVACIPTKALIHNANAYWAARVSDEVVPANMSVIQSSVRQVVNQLVDINMKNFVAAGFDLILGSGKFTGPRTILVELNDGGTRTLNGEHVLINTGTVAAIPDIEGLRDSKPMTHVEALSLEELPEHLVVIGGGYVGIEMAQAFRRLGSEVTLIQAAPRLAMPEDDDVSAAIEDVLIADGIEVRTGVQPTLVVGKSGDSVTLTLNDGSTVKATDILVAAGRAPVTQNIGLDLADVELDSRGFIKTDERLATTAPNTWAIGDVAGTPMFTHASFDDYRVIRSQLSGGDKTTKGRVIPYAMFIQPELGRVGLNEREAQEKGIDVRVARLPMAAVPRARTMNETKGFMKILIDAKSDQILGFTMLGHGAGEVMTVVQMAMLGGLPYTAVRDTIIGHPLMSEGLNILLANV